MTYQEMTDQELRIEYTRLLRESIKSCGNCMQNQKAIAEIELEVWNNRVDPVLKKQATDEIINAIFTAHDRREV